MDAKQKHLEFIQQVVTRMANNSFILKGWTITLVAALFALGGGQDGDLRFVVLAYFPVLLFWGLDGYFLRQERLFRALYDRVRLMTPEQIDYSMRTSDFAKRNKNDDRPGSVENWWYVVTSRTLVAFYGGVAALTLILIFLFTSS